ncbi:periplasmic solute binding protein [Candidatus Nitrosopumilus koreensis AR1]|uniref:Periplasmic solute binding protein n=1 Tax=Candidatus Nitrosopumilus koreensis AR1 TaxID=1229908 RepID=K0BB26_9ARCH|nr:MULTISPECIES: metal ABC transporter substrate-binding protein [Nitrosopumilus]AFS81641.1 periplasmic solute binding protein [Candidatus Nitrosopumilus koreensis AR1]
MNIQTKLAIIVISVVIPLSSLAVYGTNPNTESTSPENSKLQVISSFNPLHEFAQNVGQDKVDVTLLVPVGVEPHDWEPTIKDVQKMQASDLIIINGIGFENWVDKLDDNNYQGTIIDTSDGILAKKSQEDEYDHESGDPHIWLNPVYAKIQVQNIADAFSKHDPQNVQFYQSNAESYIEELNLLDSQIRNDLSNCNSDFIAFHDAFSYFADEYGLHQHTIISSTDSHGEATAKKLESVITTAKELNIKIIFSKETVDARTSQTIAHEIDGKVLVLSSLEIASDGTYIEKMNQNLENLKEALC